RIAPVPHRDDDVALETLGTRRSHGGHLAGSNAVRPVRIHLDCARSQASHHAVHLGPALPGLDAILPGFARGLEVQVLHVAQCSRDLIAELMTQLTTLLELIDVLRLTLEEWGNAIGFDALAWKFALGGNLQQRVPVVRRIDSRRFGG